MAIRWNKNIRAETRAVVKSFNAKIRRLQNKGVSAALLPNMISSKELQRGIDNRRDLTRRLNQLRKFTSAGEVTTDKGGVSGTTSLFKYRVGEANRTVKELEDLYANAIRPDVRYKGMQSEYTETLKSKIGYLKGLNKTQIEQMSVEEMKSYRLTASKLRKMNVKAIQRFNANVLQDEKRAIKNDQFYNNFDTVLWANANKASVPKALMDDITNLLREFTPEELLDIYNTEPSVKGVTDTYQKNKKESTEVADADVKDDYIALRARLQELLAKKRQKN